MNIKDTPLLDKIDSPKDLRNLSDVELKSLADELRQETIQSVSKTGGHLGAGLGVVELTVALHSVFDTPNDKLIWDVGHQSYPHKILTGRRHSMGTLRQKNGLSGFAKRDESEFDVFGAGHSSTSVSSGLGIAIARDLKGQDNNIICILGDGAMSAGQAYEAMNNAGALKSKLIVILNDNDMSIAPPTGAMSAYLAKLISGEKYLEFRNFAKNIVEKLPKTIEKSAKKADEITRTMSGDGTLFEAMGFYYVGPIDGHNLGHLLPVMRNVKDSDHGPILIHVVTQKGKGYLPAEKSDEKYHGVSKFNITTGEQQKSPSVKKSYTNIFSEALIKEAEIDNDIIGISAAMPSGTGLDKFQKKFPNRFFDVGIAEQHAVTFAAGMATEGLKPFVVIYSTFLQRAYDQVIHDVVIQKLPVRFMMDRAGFVGADGATHAGSFDLAYLCCLPNVVVMAPSDEAELANMIITSSNYNEGPIFCRYPRGEGEGVDVLETLETIKIGKGRIVRKGKEIAVLALGTRVGVALKAADNLLAEGYSITVADARFAKPIDTNLLLQLWETHKALIIIEEGSAGGFSSHCLHYLSLNGILNKEDKIIRCLTMPDNFQDHASQNDQLKEAGLDVEGLIKTIRTINPLTNLNSKVTIK